MRFINSRASRMPINASRPPLAGRPRFFRLAIVELSILRARSVWRARDCLRFGEALKVAEKLQGGGHANAAGATLPKSVRSIPDALIYLRQTLHPKSNRNEVLNNLDDLFAAFDGNRH